MGYRVSVVNPAGSTARMREDVLAVLGVLKVATADQIKDLVRPEAKSNKVARAALRDLQRHGLVLTDGYSQGPSGPLAVQSDQPPARRLWRLTPAGLDAAAQILPAGRQMGGTARGAGRHGAPHAMAVNDTVIAFARAGVGALITSWATEVQHPISRSTHVQTDLVLRAPEAGLPLMMIEVDRCTETDRAVAAKIDRYMEFFRRVDRSSRAAQEKYWHLMYPQPFGLDFYPPIALVFTGKGPQALANRMHDVGALTRAHWTGRHIGRLEPEGDFYDFDRSLPLLATTLDRLRQYGPLGPVWWRYGHCRDGETLDQALADPHGRSAFSELQRVREEEEKARNAQELQRLLEEAEAAEAAEAANEAEVADEEQANAEWERSRRECERCCGPVFYVFDDGVVDDTRPPDSRLCGPCEAETLTLFRALFSRPVGGWSELFTVRLFALVVLLVVLVAVMLRS